MRVLRTLQLMLFALLPPTGGGSAAAATGGLPRCSPGELRRGVQRFVDKSGELKVFFPECYGVAAPFLLFRVKRQGFSRCTVRVADGGLYLEGRR